jgi:hypothetical protein
LEQTVSKLRTENESLKEKLRMAWIEVEKMDAEVMDERRRKAPTPTEALLQLRGELQAARNELNQWRSGAMQNYSGFYAGPIEVEEKDSDDMTAMQFDAHQGY